MLRASPRGKRGLGGGRAHHPGYDALCRPVISLIMERFVNKSLCGRYPCPGLCSRVEHCVAGQERVRWLWFVRRGERGGGSPRPSLPHPEAEPRAHTHQLTRPKDQRPIRFYPVRYEEQGDPLFTRSLRVVTSPVVLLSFLIFLALVLGLGLLATGGDFAPGYEAPPTPMYYEWS